MNPLVRGWLAAACLTVALTAQGIPKQVAKLTASSPAVGSTFGYAVALSGDYALIGSNHTQGGPANSAHVFVRNGDAWLGQAVLTPSSGATVGYSYAVAISDGTAVVSDPGADWINWIGPGKVFVFVRHGTSWNQQAELNPSLSGGFSLFGSSVAVSGDTIVVGDNVRNAAYIFGRSGQTWIEQAVFTGSGSFADAVSVSGDTVVISGGAAGAIVLVRNGSTWSQQATLTASNEPSLGQFLSVSGDTAALSGGHVVYVFHRSGTIWTIQGVLDSPMTLATPTVAVSDAGNVAVVGDGEAAVAGHSQAGKAFVYVRSNGAWSPQGTMAAADPNDGDAFGRSVAVWGDTAIAGAYLADVSALNASGAAYVFHPIQPWLKLGGGLAGVGGIPVLEGQGTLETGSAGALTLTNAAPFALSVLFVSLASTPTPFKGGTLSAFPITLQLPVGTFFTGAWTLPWSAWPPGIPSGALLYYQAAVSDGAAAKGVAISNLLRATQP